MNRRHNQIGFSQRIRLDWLERTADLVLVGTDETSIYNALRDLLKDKLSVGGNARRSNREKTITILMKIWVRAPSDLHSLQREGLNLLSNLPREDRIAIHWGMTNAVYPFWGAVAAQVGRLLRLQGTVAVSHVQRRLREQYGERETVSRAARRVLRSFVNWGVLKETSEKGIYTHDMPRTISHAQIIAWLVESLLHAHPNGSLDLRAALDSPSLFPFRLSLISADQLAALSDRLNVLRHGLDQEVVTLRNINGSARKGGGSRS